MKRALLILFLLMAFPALSFAQTQKKAAPSFETLKTTPAPAPELKGPTEENGPVSNDTINTYYKDCRYNIPERFTPKAREYYCACNAAATQGNFLMKEFTELQKPETRKAQNKLFEKYVTKAVAPCVDQPVRQVEYLECLMDSSLDLRIGYVPGYCNCVSKKISEHAAKYADVEILTALYRYPDNQTDPVDALWKDSKFISTKSKAYDECIINRNQ